jgi:SAM-dependent methyltransferase
VSLPLDFVEYHFDAREMESCEALKGKTFDVITFSNVLHHIRQPLELLKSCEKKLNENGRVIFLEPNFSLLSGFIYRYIHYEYSNKHIDRPELENIQGPLSSSNIALPYLIFFKRKEWRKLVEAHFEVERISYFTSLSYFLSGGISHRIPIPGYLYKVAFLFDQWLTRMFPSLLASFFVLSLKKRS